MEALWKIIQLKRKRMKTKLICVTGSVGKSTTTSFVANVLRKKYNVFETLENRNDIFSCPAVFYKITDENEFAVIELGCGEHSSASKMSWMLNPDYIVLTQIGHAHIGKFGSIEAICTEKCGT